MRLASLSRIKFGPLWWIFNEPFTAKQKANYLKYLASERGAILDYEPIRMSLVSTGQCNLKCVMCHTHSPHIPENYAYNQEKVGAISFDLFKAAVDKYDTPLTVDIIGGGEPLLNPDLFKIAEYCAVSKHMIPKTFSNGVVLDKFIDKLLNSHLAGITVSINGHNAAEFDRLTQQGEATFERIKRNVQKLIAERNARRSKFQVKLSFILDRENVVHLPEMLDLARELDVDKVFLCNFLHTPFAGGHSDDRSIFVDHHDLIALIQRTIDEQPLYFRKRVFPPPILERWSQENKKRCDVHHTQLRVDANGDVNSCSMMLLKMKGHGHILDEGLWNNKFFTGMRKMFLNDKAPLPEPCRYCPSNVGKSFAEAAARK